MIDVNITSSLFTTLNGLLFDFGSRIFDKTAIIFLEFFMIFYGCKLAWDIGYKILFKHKLEVEDIVKPIIIVSFVTVIMSSHGYVEEWIVSPFYNLAVGLTTITATLTGDLTGSPTIMDMFHLVDQKLNIVIFQPLASIDVGWGYHLYVGIFAMMGLYVFVWFLFVGLILEAVFRFMTFYAISPLIVVSFFFPQTKPIAIAGFKSLILGMLSMLTAGMAMGLTIAILKQELGVFVVNGQMPKDWVFGPQYFTLIMISLISISFHLKAPKIAANLANLDDGAGAAAAIAGVGTMAVMSGKAAAGRMGGMLGGKAAKGAGKGIFRSGKYGIDKVKNGKNAASLYQHMTGKI